MSKIALITGVTGQDGSYLTEFLLKKNYVVYGLVRRSSVFNTARIDHLLSVDAHESPEWAKSFRDNFFMVYGDLTDAGSLSTLIHEVKPDEIYNLGAQSHVKISFIQPEFTMNVNALGNLRLLDIIKGRHIKFYQASSSEMFGNSQSLPQNEKTPFYPCSPYGISKVAAFYQTANYRESYNLFACNGILFNHESERRGENFVTRKITRAATRIKLGLQNKLYLGNLDAKRDFGYAPEYVEAMWMMLQQQKPDDYIIATGETHSVREFLEETFKYLDMDPYKYVQKDPRYLRPTELNFLLGDSSKAKKLLGWKPIVTFKELVKKMVDSDMALAESERV